MLAATDPGGPAGPDHMVTLRVPDVLYERIQHAAEALHWTLEDVLLHAVATALPLLAGLPHEVADDLGSLAFLNDTALFEVARSTPPPALHTEMDALLADKGRDELPAEGERRLDELVRTHELSTLRRGQAALLLQRRGYDMSDPAATLQGR